MPFAAQGQVSSSAVSGTVKDASGAAIPQATIVATDRATGVKTRATSDGAGQYSLPFLPPGPYNLVVEHAGFKRYEAQNLLLSAGDHPTIDIPMAIGASQQTVEVTAAAPLLGTSSATVGSLITTKQVESLPLNGRTPMVLAQITAGVVSTTNPGQVRAFDNSGISAFSVGGLPNKNSEILLDGAPDNASDNAEAYSPPEDAVKEVSVDVFESDAAYGHAGGGVANQVTQSGTNRFHGDAWEFNESSALAANGYFADRYHDKKAVTRYNQYGGTIGGPVWIPKVFDGRNKLFWFFAYEGIKDEQPATYTGSVPTAAERTGDFSALLALNNPAKNINYQIYNPFSATLVNGEVVRSPYPNNIITSPLSTIAQAVLNFYPQPNIASTSDQNNYFTQNPSQDNFNNDFARVDWAVSERQKLFVTYRYNNRLQQVNSVFGNSPALGDQLRRINNGATIDDVYTITPTLIAEGRLNYTRYEQDQNTTAAGFDSTSLGFPAYLNADSRAPRLPAFLFNSYQSVGTNLVSGSLGNAPFNSFGIYGDIVKVVGEHTIKFGTDLRMYQKGQFYFGNSNGSFSFDPTWTKANNETNVTAPSGQDLAAFLLGLPTTASYDLNTDAIGTNDYMALFVQDDWRARPDLTLNLGLRYDRDFPASERYGRANNGFDLTTPNPIAGAAEAAYANNPLPQLPAADFHVNGGLTFASAAHPDIYQEHSHMFSPRIGFAFTPAALGNKTVIRGGFSLFVLPIFPFNNAINNTGYSQTTQSPVTLNNYLSPNATLANPFPNGLVAPPGSANGLATSLGSALAFFEPNVRNGYSERWNLGVQHLLPGNYLIEVDYIGNNGKRLPISYFPNYVKPQYLTTASNPGLSAGVPNPFQGLIPNGGSLNGATVPETQLLQTYPEFGALTEQDAPNGSSYYNAGVVQVEKRPGHGITIIANYQFSRLLDRLSYLNNFDPAPQLQTSTYDHPQHAVAAITYDLPFGRGRMFGNKASRWVDLPLGGWTVNGIYTYQTGAPLSFGNVTYLGGPFDLNPRQTVGPAFNINAFSRVVPVNNIRTFRSQYNNFRNDAINNLDSSVLKDFNFTEGTYFQLRLEAFNTLNRPEFSSPNLTPSSSSFGDITGTANGSRVLQVGGRLVF